jgi:hypothetical protein
VSPDVFSPMVDRLGAFVVPYQQALAAEAGQHPVQRYRLPLRIREILYGSVISRQRLASGKSGAVRKMVGLRDSVWGRHVRDRRVFWPVRS